MITLRKENSIAILTINRPLALNALNREIVDLMDIFVEQIKEDKDIRCLIIHSDKNFAAGADVKVMATCNEEEAKAFTFTPTYDKIASIEIPTIAAIEGYALGGGMELAMTTDMRIAGKSAKMGFPEVTLGIFPGAGGTIRLPKVIGPALAKELIFTGDIIDSDRALSIGLVNKIVEDDTVLEEALKLANKIAKRGPIAVKLAKKVINKGLELATEQEGTALEAQEWVGLFNTYDQKEGMKAFIEKRKPVFENR